MNKKFKTRGTLSWIYSDYVKKCRYSHHFNEVMDNEDEEEEHWD